MLVRSSYACDKLSEARHVFADRWWTVREMITALRISEPTAYRWVSAWRAEGQLSAGEKVQQRARRYRFSQNSTFPN